MKMAKSSLRRVAKKLRLVYLGNLKFTIENENGKRLHKQKSGIAARSIQKFLREHDYVDGQFVKKVEKTISE